MNKIEKIEKFVQDMRCQIADFVETCDQVHLHKLIHTDNYLASIQDYIQKVKDEEGQ